jgi:hypothetical protein
MAESFLLNQRHAPLQLPPEHWRGGSRRPTSALSLGHGRAILILGDWGPPVVLVRAGVIPDEFEAGGGVE